MSGERRKTIMVVDDYEDMRRATRLVLETLGHRVVEAASGEEAVELAQTELPDLIIMDLSMPHLDGFAAIHRIRRLLGLRDVAVIAFSAHTAREVREDALAAGCREFLPKPVDLEVLKAAVERCLGRAAPEGLARG
jgi:two-component system, cell cycle response regulator DivK